VKTIEFKLKSTHPFILLLTSTLALTSLCFSCSDNKPSDIKDVSPDAIFFDYKIRGEEHDGRITAYLQFKRSGHNGVPLILTEPAKVELDGEVLSRDSAKLTGAFYEIQKPVENFAGKHTIMFTDIDTREYSEEFVYQPFQLKTKIPTTISREQLVFDFDGLEPVDYLRVSLIDTAFMSRDINEIDTVKDGRLIIPSEKLYNLVDGPITLLLYRETERPIRNGTRAGGRIVVSYGIQRVFELRPPDLPR
jgi:hypothetical protein